MKLNRSIVKYHDHVGDIDIEIHAPTLLDLIIAMIDVIYTSDEVTCRPFTSPVKNVDYDNIRVTYEQDTLQAKIHFRLRNGNAGILDMVKLANFCIHREKQGECFKPYSLYIQEQNAEQHIILQVELCECEANRDEVKAATYNNALLKRIDDNMWRMRLVFDL